MIQGIIDIGSNTIRMAVYEIEDDKITLLLKKKYTVGLASYIQSNLMQQDGIDKACEILEEFKLFLEKFNIENVVSFATAALRNIDNSKEVMKEIIDRTKIDIHVISGEEEADLAFCGAIRTTKIKNGLLIDIGGASTEIVSYKERKITNIVSLPIGSLALHKKYVKGLMPTSEEAREIEEAIFVCLKEEKNLKQETSAKICGIGGTFKGIYLLNNKINPESTEKISAENLNQMMHQFICDSNMISLENLDILVEIVPERIKTIVPGMVIANTLIGFFKSKEIFYSDSGVREGYIYKKIIQKEEKNR